MLLAVCREFGIEEKVDPRIAFGFAGGIGNTGSVCGAVSGAVMAIGLLVDKGETEASMLGALAVPAEFRRRFEAEMETINCRELTGADLTTPEGVEAFMKSDAPMMACFPAVAKAYEIAVALLKEKM